MIGKKFTLDEVKFIIKQSGNTPLFNEYKNNKELLKCECPKHGIFYISLSKIQQAIKNGFNGCRKCANERNGKKYKLNIDKVKIFILKMGLIPLFDEYKNNQIPLLVKCPIHGEFKISLANLQRAYKHNTNGCRKCALDKIRIKSPEDRVNARDTSGYRQWQRKIYKKFNYKCQKCGGTKYLNAHHLYNFASHIELRIDENNGICLCEKCHQKFHKQFGLYNNTPEQIQLFLNQI